MTSSELIQALIASATLTAITYGAGPFFFATLRKKPLPVRFLRRFCIGYTVLVWILWQFFTYDGYSVRVMPAIIWGAAFYNIAKRILKDKLITPPPQQEPPEQEAPIDVSNIKNPALRARAELYRSSRESAGQPGKSWPAPGEKLCGTPFAKAGKEVPAEPAPRADAPKKEKHTRLEFALSIICAVLVVSTAVLGYKVYEFREMVIAFVNVNDELLQENKALESEVEELQREVSSMSSGSSDVDDFTRRYLELREQRLGTSYYVASVNSDIYHRSSCDYVDNILEENRTYYLSKLRAIIDGKQPCSVCMP